MGTVHIDKVGELGGVGLGDFEGDMGLFFGDMGGGKDSFAQDGGGEAFPEDGGVGVGSGRGRHGGRWVGGGMVRGLRAEM